MQPQGQRPPAERPDELARKPLARADPTPRQLADLLADATSLLLSDLDYESAVARLGSLIVSVLGDWCAIDLLEDDGALRRLAVAHADPSKRDLAGLLEGRFSAAAPWGPARVVRTGADEQYADLSQVDLITLALDPDRVPILRELGARSAVCVPLRAHGRILGALTVVRAAPDQPFRASDLAAVRVLGSRLGLALDRAAVYRLERAARRAAERASRRTTRLQAVTEALAEAITPAQVADVVVREGIEALGASAGILAILGEDETDLTLVCAVGYPEALVAEWRRIPLDTRNPFTDTVRTGEPIFLDDHEGRSARYPAFARIATLHEAGATIPLAQGGRVAGVVGFGFSERREFAPEDQGFMLTLARQGAQALDRARLYEAERRARAEAEAANRAKDDFLTILSHELRSPLTAMLGWVRLLRTGRLDAVTLDRALETIERNARVQSQLINDLLDVSRIISGKLRLETELVDLKAVVEGALDAARPAAQAKGLRLEADLDPAAAVVSGDPGRLAQIVANLLSNAVKFTPEGGRVDVTLSRVDHETELRVADTGQGIRPEFLPHVFERFRQQDSTATRAHTGLGLGLAIVRHLVELHGGSVAANSQGEGRGATFIVRLPVPAALLGPAEAGPPGRQADCAERELKGLRVLVVDDAPDALDLVAEILQRAGASVATVLSAAEARSAFDGFRPDVLVCDIAMPEESGYALIRDVRAREPEQGGAIPAIALTAYASLEDRQRALSAGFHRHMAKPIDPDELVRTIAALAGRALRT